MDNINREHQAAQYIIEDLAAQVERENRLCLTKTENQHEQGTTKTPE